MTESFRERCAECGDEAVIEQVGVLYCARHQLPPENPFEALARRRMEQALPSDAEAQRLARELEVFEREEWRDRVLGITRSWVASTVFDRPRETFPARAVVRWLSEGCKPSVLVLRGGVGVGKTSAAVLAVRQWCKPGVFMSASGPALVHGVGVNQVSWLRPDQLVSAIMHEYDPSWKPLCPHVVIDDLGRETRAEFVEALCELLDRDHTVLITTNLTKDAMKARYGKDPRLLDRLRHRAKAVDIPGETLRKKNGDF